MTLVQVSQADEIHPPRPQTCVILGYISSAPAMTGTALEFDIVDVFVLSNGHTIRRLAGVTGDTVWGYSTPDMGYVPVPFLHIITSA